nr:HlyD family type I secretion periplasmic adaptor subunit [Methylobacterium crusticola]
MPTRRRAAIVSEFQPDAVAVEERAPPRAARATLYLVTALIATAVAWACLTEIDEIAVARGKLVTTEPNIVVQPLETASIRSIAVAVGQTVSAGDVLAVLDPTFSEADVQQLTARFSAMDAMVSRLEAEFEGRDMPRFDMARPEQALEARLARQRKAFRESRLRTLDEDIARAESGLLRNRREETVLVQRLDGLREIEAMRTTLLEHQTGSKLNLLQTRDTRLDIEASLVRTRGAQVEAGHDLEKARAQRQAFLDETGRTTLESLAEAREKRTVAAEELRKAALRRQLVTLTAPADGIVLDIAQRGAGSVVRQAEPLLTLVPTGSAIEAEVMIHPRDIGHVAVGQTARVKFDAFPFQKHGTGGGIVRTLSQDAFQSEPDGRAPGASAPSQAATLFYKARVALTDTPLRALPAGARVLPGMAVQGEILVGRRRVISYFLYPLLQVVDEGIREP